jgi:hypothetical protein
MDGFAKAKHSATRMASLASPNQIKYKHTSASPLLIGEAIRFAVQRGGGEAENKRTVRAIS